MYLFADAKSDRMRIAIGTFAFAVKTLGGKCKTTHTNKNIGKYRKIAQNLDKEAFAAAYEQSLVTSFDLTIGAGYSIRQEGKRQPFGFPTKTS